MAQIFTNMPQLLGLPRIAPQLLGRFGAINTNDEVFTPAPAPMTIPQTMAAMQKAVIQTQQDAPPVATRVLVTPSPQPGCPACACPAPEKKKSWPWLLFVGLGSAAVATGITVAAVGNRKR